MIRNLEQNELPQLLELYRHLHSVDDPLPNPETVQNIWKHVCQDPALQYFGAFLGQQLISSCTLTVIPNLTRGCRPYGLIENVVTDREYRRQGYGRSILEFALGRAWEQNCYKVMLLTGRLDQATLHFYEEAGFDSRSKQAFIAKPKK